MLKIKGKVIRVLKTDDPKKSLGREVGVQDFIDAEGAVGKMIDLSQKVERSGLSPRQRLVALHTFVQPKLDYLMRVAHITRRTLSYAGSEFRGIVRTVVDFPNPKYTTREYISAPQQCGAQASCRW